MVIKNRQFPYPVLCEDIDDYTTGSFNVSSEIVQSDMNSVKLKFNIELDNPGIKSLITSGKAEYVIHVECSDTAFRTAIPTYSDEEIYTITTNRVNGKVSLLGMVVAKEMIPFYKNSALNPDYDDVDLMIPKAAILAYDNMDDLNITKDYEELSSEESIFSVVKHNRLDENEENPLSFDLDTNRIVITVDDNVFSEYAQYQKNIAMRPLIFSLLLMPALTHMIEELRRTGCEAYEDYRWFIKFSNYYQQQGKDFVEEIDGEKTIAQMVQELLQLPIGKTFLNMREMLGE